MLLSVMCNSLKMFLFVLVASLLLQAAVAQIPAVCADRLSLETMTCCPTTPHGICGEDAGRGRCVDVNFPRHSNQTTDVRVNWPHYYTRVCECDGNFGGYDCTRCKYGYYGENCSRKAILQRKALRDFTDEEWEDYIEILRLAKFHRSSFVAVLEETLPGTGEPAMATNVTIYNMMVWFHHYASKDAADLSKPSFVAQPMLVN